MIIYVHVHCTRYMHNRMCMCVVHSSLRNHKISVHPKKHEVQHSKSKIVVRYVKSVTRVTHDNNVLGLTC
jgi:hypothetical protein